MASKAQVKAFIEMIAPIVVDVIKTKKRQSLPSVCIAQCCAESGYGTSAKMIAANAVLGIKVGKSKAHFGTAWNDKAYSSKTKECYDGKTYTQITDMFRAYDSIRDSIEDYFDMLATCSRYKNCIGETDPKKCITAIVNGGYATDPNYITMITKIIETNNLTQYDDVVTKVDKGDAPAVEDTSTENFILGQKVRVETYFSTAYSNGRKVVKSKVGVITKIKSGPGIKYPFLISINGTPIGWTKEAFMYMAPASQNAAYTYHSVQPGECLSKLAKKYGTTVANIVSMNKHTYPSISANFIRVYWKLRVK